MWNKIKIIGLIIALIAVTIAGLIFGRNSNGRGISDNNGLSDDIADGIDRSTERIDEIKGSVASSTESIDRANGRIGNAQDKLRAAIEILRAAKEKG